MWKNLRGAKKSKKKGVKYQDKCLTKICTAKNTKKKSEKNCEAQKKTKNK